MKKKENLIRSITIKVAELASAQKNGTRSEEQKNQRNSILVQH